MENQPRACLVLEEGNFHVICMRIHPQRMQTRPSLRHIFHANSPGRVFWARLAFLWITFSVPQWSASVVPLRRICGEAKTSRFISARRFRLVIPTILVKKKIQQTLQLSLRGIQIKNIYSALICSVSGWLLEASRRRVRASNGLPPNYCFCSARWRVIFSSWLRHFYWAAPFNTHFSLRHTVVAKYFQLHANSLC